MMRSAFEVQVSERTLKSWGAKLIDRGILAKVGEKRCWRSLGNDKRELVTGDPELEAEAREYYIERSKLIKKYGKDDIGYKRAFNELWSKYGCCYYCCKGFELAAYDNFTDDLFYKIYELVEAIINEKE